MQARTLRVVALFLVVACSGGEVTEPPRQLGTNPLSAISDGANSGGNTDFFFLPPMVDDPSGNPLFLNNGLNTSLIPTVTVTNGATTVFGPVPAVLTLDHYKVNWQVPISSTSTTYRVTVKLGNTALGFADVFAAANSADLKNADNDVVALKDGRNLPIKFTIENFALCGTTGQPTCASETIDLTTGGTVTVPTGGVEIPAQPSGSSTTVTVSSCPDIPSDLPHHGSCLRILANPPIPDLTIPAEVWVCDSGIGAGSTDQEKRVTMHRYDAPNTKALPHADDQCVPSITEARWSLKGILAHLVNRRFESAGKQLKAMMSPRLLHAAVLDVGAGGLTDNFSDFQLLRPAKMAKCGGDGLTVAVSSVVAVKVCVTDLAGDAVQGAVVHLSTSNGSVTPLAVTTNALGEATASWTISATPGANSLVASGNGIASSTANGPRGTFDPFQPFPYGGPPTPESGTPSGPVNVLTGSETFTATATAGGISITNVAINTTTLFIGGDQAAYTAELLNPTGAPVGSFPGDPVSVQGWTDQVAPAASRAAGGAITFCGAPTPNGTLPTGTCFHSFSFGAANFGASGLPSAGTGTLMPGSATAKFELKHGTVVEDEFTIPITIYQIRPVASSLTSASSTNVLVPIVNPSGLSMQAGATIQLEVAPGATTAWSSSNAAAATVNATGLVTAVAGNTNPSSATEATISANIGTAIGSMKVNSFTFGHFPRLTTLAWVPVAGAATYDVITEFGNGCTAGTAVCSTWTGGVVATGVITTAYHFEFVGAQPGRWRIVARDGSGSIISTSADVYFRYTV